MTNLLMNTYSDLDPINKTMTKFHAVTILWFVLAAFFAIGAIAICTWYFQTVWSIEFLWGMVKVTCGS